MPNQKGKWLRHESYSVYHQGLVRRAHELGFSNPDVLSPHSRAHRQAHRPDPVCPRHSRPSSSLPPFGNRRLGMTWQRYACVGTGYVWEQQQFDRVAHDHDQNVFLAVQ